MAEVNDETKKEFIEGMEQVQHGAYKMLELWEGEFADRLHQSGDFLKAYPLELSFDEWWHEWARFVEITKKVLRYDLHDGDCLNCIRGNDNPHHEVDVHQLMDEGEETAGCKAKGCDCRGYYSIEMSV